MRVSLHGLQAQGVASSSSYYPAGFDAVQTASPTGVQVNSRYTQCIPAECAAPAMKVPRDERALARELEKECSSEVATAEAPILCSFLCCVQARVGLVLPVDQRVAGMEIELVEARRALTDLCAEFSDAPWEGNTVGRP